MPTKDPPQINGDNIVDLSNRLPPAVGEGLTDPLHLDDDPNLPDYAFLRALAQKIYEVKRGGLKPDDFFDTDITGLESIAEVLDSESTLPLPLERPTIDAPWDYSMLRDRYIELADAYEELFDLDLEAPTPEPSEDGTGDDPAAA
jgi:hypothetical protein